MNQPTVSVVIPTYNHQQYVLKALDSVFVQSFSDGEVEVIVVNDGSPDDTDSVLRPAVEAGIIRYIRQENAGQSAARNRGIAEAQGEFVALLDDDDQWPADKLEWQVTALRENPDAALVYGSVRAIDGSGTIFTPADSDGNPPYWMAPGPTGDVYERFMEKCLIVSPGACLMRRSCLEALGENGPFDLKIQGGADDYDFYLRLARKFPFVFVDRVALHYRLHGSNASGDTAKLWLSLISVQRKMYGLETDSARRRLWKTYRDEFATYVARVALQSIEKKHPHTGQLPRAKAMHVLSKLRAYVPAAILAETRVRLGAARQRQRVSGVID